MKKTVITKCGEELLGPQASLRVTPYQPVPNHTKGAFWFCCLLYFFPDYHHVMSFFFLCFSFFYEQLYFWTTVIFFGYGFGTCQLPFFPLFFFFFLFGIRYNIFLSVYVIITTYYFLFSNFHIWNYMTMFS